MTSPTVILLLTTLTFVTAFRGDLTYYYPDSGHTACGTLHKNSDFIAAISWRIYIRTPNPNNSPSCNHCALIKHGGNSALVRIKDKCGGCKAEDIDVSPVVFQRFADLGVGRMKVDWEFVPCPSGNGSNGGGSSEPPKPKKPKRRKSNYCGRSFSHSRFCRKRFPKGLDRECPRGQRCYAKVRCRSSKPKSGPPSRPKKTSNHCGASYTDSLACRHTCPKGFDFECPQGQRCYDSVPC